MKLFKKYEDKIKKIIIQTEKETGEKVSWIDVKRNNIVGFQSKEDFSVKIKVKE